VRLICDVVLTFGEFIVGHEQCNYQAAHIELKIKTDFENALRRSTAAACTPPGCYEFSPIMQNDGTAQHTVNAMLAVYGNATDEV